MHHDEDENKDVDEDDTFSGAETLHEPTYTLEMREALHVVHTRAPQAPRPITGRPGKLRFVGSGLPPGDRVMNAFEIRDYAGMLLKHVSAGAMESLIMELAFIYTRFRGDQEQLHMLGRTLVDELDTLGVIAKVGDRALAFHDIDSPYAVEFQFDRDIDFNTKSMYTTVTAQSYTWETDDPLAIDPAILIAQISKRLKGTGVGTDCKGIKLEWLR